jgi:hypothetical protein
MVNNWVVYTDSMVIKGVLSAPEEALRWLGSLERAEQIEVLTQVKRLCSPGRLPNLGPRGAFEIIWRVRTLDARKLQC